ncbi:hypothetical protein DD600_25925 [Enterobacter cloacae]|uniref:hypothetical protein n=1 Tax=Enterobacter cloacae TaxID=550 RepID=UPI001012E506|nr:hypothetical protein [Enterobacter cloacae]RXX53783.1 hypothetical protein DD600_25925 [Enterobacter cloacae]
MQIKARNGQKSRLTIWPWKHKSLVLHNHKRWIPLAIQKGTSTLNNKKSTLENRERLSVVEISFAYVPTQDNLADLFTKALSREKLEAFHKALGLLPFVD